MYHLQYTLPLYFGFAIGYDVYISVVDLVTKGVLSNDLHKGLHVGGPFTTTNGTQDAGQLIPVTNTTLGSDNFTNFLTGDL